MNLTTSEGRVLSDRYLIEGLLGVGGMASVWRARDLRLDRSVAIKELAGPWLADGEALQRFDREARMTARLAHPNIVAVYDVAIHERTPYLVMELIEGATLAELLVNGRLTVKATVAIAAQACDGVAAAHAAGVIHRDIKPANLMLTNAAVVKICDFGIARALSGAVDPTMSAAAVALGTSRYMAPEQASGQRVDARADLYALGCTMYAMLAGAPPFQGTVAEVIHQHLHQAPAPLRMYRGDIPVPLEDLVMRLLAKDPDHRPSIADAKAVLAGLADSPTPTSPDGERRAASATRRWRFAAASAVAIVVPATVGLWILRGPDQPAAATTPLGTPSLTTAAIAPPPSGTSEPQASSSAGTPPKQASQASSSTPAQSGTQVPPSDPIAALRLAVQQQVSTGNLNPDKASDLYAKVDAIAHSAYTGNATDEAKNVKAFQDRLTALRTGGQLSASGYDVLSAAADAVSATLP